MTQVYKVEWSSVKAVLFDVDGTLYTQSVLRRKMMRALLGYYARRPWQAHELWLLQRFRAAREKRPGYAGGNLAEVQYDWASAGTPYSPATVRRAVTRWMLEHPNQYLTDCMLPGVQEFWGGLRTQGIAIGIYSDYPAHAKLAAMGLQADAVVSSIDPQIDRLKPDPKGLLYLADYFCLPPEACLFIGDRPELDGACARQAGMPYLLVPRPAPGVPDFYPQLTEQLFAHFTSTDYAANILTS
ncbi:hypothetical protein GCM10027048_43270 [Hymenobacter coalescens]